MAKKVSIEQKLENHIKEIQAKIAGLQKELEAAQQNYDNYVTHRSVIESILSLKDAPEVTPPKRKYTRRIKPTE